MSPLSNDAGLGRWFRLERRTARRNRRYTRSWPLRTARMAAPHAARLFVTERAHRLDARGAVGGDDVSQDADGYEEQSDGGEREWVRGTDAED